jgi:PIN domain nuclease of toxin-antitoxin system
VASQGFELLPISGKHAARAGFYAVDRSDPFDRMLAAQAEVDDLFLATNDRRFADFGTRVLW